jgi:hypothetical protein
MKTSPTTSTFRKLLFGLLLLFILLHANLATVNASVGVEYLGPYPLSPKPTGMAGTLADSAVIGNSGTEPARVTLTLVADDEFKAHFAVTFSDNNFTLSPGERKTVTFTFNLNPNTPIRDWTASIAIVAEAVHVPPGVSPGKASFTLQVLVRAGATTETATATSVTSAITTSVTSAITTSAVITTETVSTEQSHTPISSPRCVIATAAYGSELAPEVVYMRYVRDRLIGSTPTGRTLVASFNVFYYSWSPPLAERIAGNGLLRALFRVLLLPLVGIVHITALTFMGMASMTENADMASVVAFVAAAAMTLTIYVVLPVVGATEVTQAARGRLCKRRA